MGKVLTRKDLDLSVGAYHFSDRKRPSVCVRRGNRITVFGSFYSEEGADLFMEALAELTGAVEEEG